MNITKSEEIKAELQRNFQRGKSTTVCYGYKKWNEGQRTEEIQPTLPARGATRVIAGGFGILQISTHAPREGSD